MVGINASSPKGGAHSVSDKVSYERIFLTEQLLIGLAATKAAHGAALVLSGPGGIVVGDETPGKDHSAAHLRNASHRGSDPGPRRHDRAHRG